MARWQYASRSLQSTPTLDPSLTIDYALHRATITCRPHCNSCEPGRPSQAMRHVPAGKASQGHSWWWPTCHHGAVNFAFAFASSGPRCLAPAFHWTLGACLCAQPLAASRAPKSTSSCDRPAGEQSGQCCWVVCQVYRAVHTGAVGCASPKAHLLRCQRATVAAACLRSGAIARRPGWASARRMRRAAPRPTPPTAPPTIRRNPPSSRRAQPFPQPPLPRPTPRHP